MGWLRREKGRWMYVFNNDDDYVFDQARRLVMTKVAFVNGTLDSNVYNRFFIRLSTIKSKPEHPYKTDMYQEEILKGQHR
eukprot:1352584-Amorphochlora_amoeboformis.AAC.2